MRDASAEGWRVHCFGSPPIVTGRGAGERLVVMAAGGFWQTGPSGKLVQWIIRAARVILRTGTAPRMDGAAGVRTEVQCHQGKEVQTGAGTLMGRGSQRLVTSGFLNHQVRKRPQQAPPRPTEVGTPAAPSSVLRLFRAMSSEDGSAMNEGHRPRLRIAAGVPTSVGRRGALIAPVGPSNASKAAYEHRLEVLPDQASSPLLPLLPLMALD